MVWTSSNYQPVLVTVHHVPASGNASFISSPVCKVPPQVAAQWRPTPLIPKNVVFVALANFQSTLHASISDKLWMWTGWNYRKGGTTVILVIGYFVYSTVRAMHWQVNFLLQLLLLPYFIVQSCSKISNKGFHMIGSHGLVQTQKWLENAVSGLYGNHFVVERHWMF